MSIIENIKKRTSVRTYAGEPLSENDKNRIIQFINNLSQPLGGKARIELVSRKSVDDKAVKLGTYGVISGANDYLLLIYEDGVLAQENAGYMFEEVVLYCTSLGLGTCWLGGTFNRNDFKDNVQMSDKEKLPIVSPVGYPKEKRSFLDRMMRSAAKSEKRKNFEEIFFSNDFHTPLTQDTAGEYFTPLEMVRLAPSASNSQPWRVILQENKLHFYDSLSNRFSFNDLGIALCHFKETCYELNIDGKFEILEEQNIPNFQKMRYTISWLSD
ncbi:nitroreductase family protein [Bacteroidales bacterium OttesenSCG-928-K03]|nr:nitroreductase family protein [Bacteroidales bacterium OttesenSCG-928-L14]MDL2242531.1 nitroreductase family protein [Bacteroidales bacterium OttesenSCG-928-K03]